VSDSLTYRHTDLLVSVIVTWIWDFPFMVVER